MLKLLVLCLSTVLLASAVELPSRRYLNLAAIKTMVAAAESEAQKRNVQVTNLGVLLYPDGFPNQGGLPIKVDDKLIGAVACSGAASEVDEAISQVAINALLK